MRNLIFAMALSAVTVLAAGPVRADEKVDMVVLKMAEGDIATICGGGIGAITEAATTAITSLAQAGRISGDFAAIGQAAGAAFFGKHCG